MFPITDVTRLGTVLGIWAHPDDEAFLSAGLMAAARDAGQRVVCVTATLGEHGTDDPGSWPPMRMAQVREREWHASLAALGACRGDIVGDFLWFQYGRWKLRHNAGLGGIVVSRPCLEMAVRRRVRALAAVTRSPLIRRVRIPSPMPSSWACIIPGRRPSA